MGGFYTRVHVVLCMYTYKYRRSKHSQVWSFVGFAGNGRLTYLTQCKHVSLLCVVTFTCMTLISM